jgi:hypothetical protein
MFVPSVWVYVPPGTDTSADESIVAVATGPDGEELFLHPVITLNATTKTKTKNKTVFFIFVSPY